MLAAQDLLQEGLRKTIGTGASTRVWLDLWLPTVLARAANDVGIHRDQNLFVNQLIDQITKQWKTDELHSLFDPEDIPLIQSIRPCHNDKEDGYCWIYTKSGRYTVKSGYKLASQLKEEKRDDNHVSEPSVNPLKALRWTLKTTRKVKHFLWQAISECIATCSRLVDRHCGIDRTCPRCGERDETVNHLLFLCPPALQTWALSDIPTSLGVFPSEFLYENLTTFSSEQRKEERQRI